MFAIYTHSLYFLSHSVCYGLLAWHAHRATPEICLVYWILTAASLIHLALAIRILLRKRRWCRWKKQMMGDGANR